MELIEMIHSMNAIAILALILFGSAQLKRYLKSLLFK